ncbi:MAG: hypothetical protein JJT85_00635 [Chromatiales bacterium]|nr:hypothetical protein [Chromatiales bacterium]
MTASCRGSLRGRGRSPLLVLLAGGILAGCGGEDGVGLASGQGPDPVIVDIPIAYVKRAVPVNNQGNVIQTDARRLLTFQPGADLYLRDRAAPAAAERNITGELTQGQYDIRDLSVSFEGDRILFAMRGPFIPGAQPEDQPTWNIWEYDILLDELRRVIASPITAELGHDVSPQYLPDGRIIFTSTRQRRTKAMLLDEGKPQFDPLDEDLREPAFVLHVMNADGSDIRQVTFNMSHDRDPAVLDNGQVVFARWDRFGPRNAISLYRMNPDGTALELLYGRNSHATGTGGATVQFLRPRPMPDGRVIALLQPFQVDDLGGDLVLVDVEQYVENTQPLAQGIGILQGPAQEPATLNDVRTDGSISPGGKYAGAWPLYDGTSRMFVSWSQCRLRMPDGRIQPCTEARLAEPGVTAAPPLYSIWIYDFSSGTKRPVLVPQEGLVYSEIVATQARPRPPIILDQMSAPGGPGLAEQGLGLLNIRSVYDVNGVDTITAGIDVLADPARRNFSQRSSAWLRIEKGVAIPDDDVRDFSNQAFGRGGVRIGMREIIGYAPIEPDGSVVVKVPADVPIALSVLDRDGRRRTSRHQAWLQVRPGEMLSCIGCHSASSGLSHGRQDAFESAWPGAQTTSLPFPNTNPAFFADFGETMAEAKARISCATDCALITPSVDVVYDDIWTWEPDAGRAPDPSIEWRYADLQTEPPTSLACQIQWTAECRTVINYETHIHPLWSVPRQVLDPEDEFTVVADFTCTACHTRTDAMGMPQVPAGQLTLTDGPSAQQPLHFMSYRELLFNKLELELVEGALQTRLVEVGVDEETGEPILVTVNIPAPMSTGGARSSPRFFSLFAPGGSHEGWLSPAELRLVSEWIDIGGQYFNNPFDAPEQ